LKKKEGKVEERGEIF
jgi:hypothetical protein